MSTEYKVALTFEGNDRVDIVCRDDEDVVTAAFRQGYLLLTDCREGSCATCRGFLAEGDYDELLPHTPHALTDEEEDEGYILACRLKPTSDLEIDFDYPADRVGRFEADTRTGQVVSVDRLSESVARMTVRTNASQECMAWDPGQYAQVTLTSTGVTRAYSMANTAGGGRDLEFLIRLIPGGQFSGHVASGLANGEPVRIRGPLGAFTFRGDARPVFVAGGTGLGPVLSMLRSLVGADPGIQATLIFGVAAVHDLFALDVLADLAAKLPNLKVITTVERPSQDWTGATGVVSDHLGDVENATSYYLCGPPAMIGACEVLLDSQGVPMRHVHTERFLEMGDQ